MSDKQNEKKGAAAAIPVGASVMKPAAAVGLKAFFASNAGIAVLSGVLGLGSIGVYQMATGGGAGSGQESKGRIAAAKSKAQGAAAKKSKVRKADPHKSTSLAMVEEANMPLPNPLAEQTQSGEPGARESGEAAASADAPGAVEDIDTGALSAQEASKAEMLRQAQKISKAKPKMDGSLSGMSSGAGAGASAGGAAQAGGAGAGQLAMLSAARGPADGKITTGASSAGGKLSKSRKMNEVNSRGGGTGGGGGRAKTSLSKLDAMNRKFKGATGSGSSNQYSTQQAEWDGGRKIEGAGADEDDSGDGNRRGNSFSPAQGEQGGRPLSDSYGNGARDGYGNSSRGINGTNVTPYQQMVDMAQALLMLASALISLSFIMGVLGKNIPTMGAAFYSMAKMLAYAAAAVAAVVTLLGLGIMMQGQATQGAVFTGVGALLTILSYTSAEGYGEAAKAPEVVKGEAIKKGSTAAAKLKGSLWTSGIGGAAGFGGAAATNGNEGGWADEYKESTGQNGKNA
jgi:hypothetical protein